MLGTGRKLPALALVAALAFAGCGSGDDGTIPPDDADALLAQVDDIRQSAEREDCTAGETNIQQLRGGVDQLPKEVGVETKQDLFKLVDNLETLVEDACEGPDTTTTPDEPDIGASGEEGTIP